MKKIVIEVDEEGNLVLETHGFQGKSCISESEWVKELIGEELKRHLKPCYFSNDKEKVTKKRWLNICG